MRNEFLKVVVGSLCLCWGGLVMSQTVGYSGEVVIAYGKERGAARFFKPDNKMGCGTVVSVRNVNQTPQYDRQYESQFGSPSNTTDIAALAVQTGVVGLVAAAATSLAVDTAVSANRETQTEIKLLNIATDQGLVKAVQLRMDDGVEINLPLLDANKFDFSGHYKVGNRYQVFYSPTFDNVQLVKSGESASYSSEEKAKVMRNLWCKRTLAEEKTKAVLEAHAHKVDETKIY